MRRGALITALIAALAGGAPAQAPDTENDRARLIGAKAAAAEAEARAAGLQAAASQAESQADRAHAQAAALALRVTAAEEDLTAARARIALVSTAAARQRARIAEREQPILHLTAALQTMARRPAALAVAQPGSVDDLVHVRLLLNDILPVIAERTASVRAELARSTRVRDDAEQAAAALSASRVLLARRRREYAALEATALRRSQALAEQAATEAERALGLGEDARDIADRLRVQQDARQVVGRLDALAPPVPRPGGGEATVPLHEGRARYLLPVAGRVATGFGEVSEAGVRARGLTMLTAPDAQVVAPGAGTILFAGRFRSYGQVVILAHGGGWTTTVTGLATLAVKAGQSVRQGAPLGRVGGDRPQATAELRRNGRPIDLLAMVQAG